MDSMVAMSNTWRAMDRDRYDLGNVVLAVCGIDKKLSRKYSVGAVMITVDPFL